MKNLKRTRDLHRKGEVNNYFYISPSNKNQYHAPDKTRHGRKKNLIYRLKVKSL